MNTLGPVAITNSLSRQTMKSMVERSLMFIRAVGNDPVIRAAMGAAGYTDADTEQGFQLVRDVVLAPDTPPPPENQVAKANADIRAWAKLGFPLMQFALTHLHHPQYVYLFEGLDTANVAESALNLSIFLDRCTDLESGKDRKAMHKGDRAALATMSQRGLTKTERRRLEALVVTVSTEAAPLPVIETTAEEREIRILALRGWLMDWTGVAKTVIKRRDLLLKLGVGKRRPRQPGHTPAEPVPVAAPSPLPVGLSPSAPVAEPLAPIVPVAAPSEGPLTSQSAPAKAGAEEPSPTSSAPTPRLVRIA